MNALSTTLRVIAILGALAAAYFWHDTGKQKQEQFAKIGELNKKLGETETTLKETTNKLNSAESKADSNQKLYDTEKSGHNTTREQLADARREVDATKEKLTSTETKLADSEQAKRTLADEVESFRVQLEKSVSPEKHKALERQLAESKDVAKGLQTRIDELTAAALKVTNPDEEIKAVENKKVLTSVPKNFNRVVSAKVKQVKGENVLLEFGKIKGALLNSDIRLQNGLDYIGFGRIIFVDDNQSLVTLNEGHEDVPAGKEIFLMVPETVAVVAPVVPAAK